jgi:hypothetical protein
VKFWMAGDLGGDFSTDQMDWAVLTFEPSTTKEQRTAITTILSHVYPVKWRSFTVAEDAAMEWSATRDRAEARLDGGRAAEVVLHKAQGATDDAIVIKRSAHPDAERCRGLPGGRQGIRVQGHQRLHGHHRHDVEGRPEVGWGQGRRVTDHA